MKASELPVIPGCTHFLIRAAYRWGRGATIHDAIKAAQVRHLEVVHVFRCDAEARCDIVDGGFIHHARGDIWEGRVWGKDITLKKVVLPMKDPAEGRSSE